MRLSNAVTNRSSLKHIRSNENKAVFVGDSYMIRLSESWRHGWGVEVWQI